MPKKIITVMRNQVCQIAVEVPDDWTEADLYYMDADALCNRLSGLDWEDQPEYSVEDVRDPTAELLAECSAETSV